MAMWNEDHGNGLEVSGALEYNVTDDKLFDEYPPGLLTFASVTCLVYMLVGVPGNLITIIALARCKKVRNATAVFIINLSLSDLLFCCFNLPLATSTYWFSAWTHGDLLCRLFPLLRYGLSAVSLFTVLAITLNRYVMIGHPRVYPKIYRHRYLGVMVAATWIFAFSALVPTWRGTWGRFGLDRTIGSCSILPDKNNTSPKDFFFVMAFVVPCLAIVVCYARIFYIVRKTAMRSHEPVVQTKSLNASMLIPMQRNIHRTSVSSPQELGTTAASTNNHPPCAGVSGAVAGDNFRRAAALQINHGQPPSLAKRRRTFEADSNSMEHYSSDHSSSTTVTCHMPPVTATSTTVTHGPRISLRFIDSRLESEQPVPSDSTVAETLTQENSSSISICKSTKCYKDWPVLDDVQSKKELEKSSATSAETDCGESTCEHRTTSVRRKRFRQNSKKMMEVDSALEESTSSSDNQIYHIHSGINFNDATELDPSSSGIDMPMDDDGSPRRLVGSLAASLRRIKRSRQTTAGVSAANTSTTFENHLRRIDSRKHSTINTSGASMLYPGRMSAKDRRLLKMILVILSAFVACYLPITASKVFRPIQQNSYLNIMGYLLIYLTTCINPIIYVVMSSEYRQAYWNLLMCRLSGTRRVSRKSAALRDGGQKNDKVGVHLTAERLIMADT